MIAQAYKAEFEAHVIVAETVERMAESMVASVPTHAMVDWRVDCERILALSHNVTQQAHLLREHQLLRLPVEA
jgi:hypothetical protein